jgi:K+-sensing histidine kinase KdpD
MHWDVGVETPDRGADIKMREVVAKSPSRSPIPVGACRSVAAMSTREGDQASLAASIGALGLLVFSMFLVPLRDVLGAANVAIILLLGVQILAIIAGRQGGIIGAVVAALSFDFFFTEPYLRLVINDEHDIITAVLLLLAGVATSELSSLRVRRELRMRERGDPPDW